MPNYICWTRHGERGVLEAEEEEEDEDPIPADYVQYAQYGFADEEVGEAEEHEKNDSLAQMLHDEKEECENEKVRKKLERMLEDHKTPLYPDCKKGKKKLRTTLELLQWKAANGISDKGFNEILELIKNILPEGEKLPASTYEAKEIVCPVGLEMQKIHACPNDCILYRKEYEELEACPVCEASRYKIRRDDPGDVEEEPPGKEYQ